MGKKLNAMWFFHSKPLIAISIIAICVFLGVNLAIFFHNYNYWSRFYHFALSGVFATGCSCIVFYWITCRRTEKPHSQTDTLKLITVPVIAMTTLMSIGSVLGNINFIYFTSVFAWCDEAVEAAYPWELVSDFIFYLVLIISFVLYPIFIFRCYLHPLMYRWRWLFYWATSTLVVLFLHICLKEAFHTYIHVCDSSHAEEHGICPTVVREHHFHCEKENFTKIQSLWLEMQEQVVGPGTFLVIAEYIPLLFVLIWMAPVRNSRGKMRTSIRLFSYKENQKKHLRTRRKVEKPEEKESDIGEHVEQTQPPTINHPPPKPETIVVSVGCFSVIVIMLFRLGLLLNHLGRHPEFELILEASGHLVSALALSAMYLFAYFLWLRKHNTETATVHFFKVNTQNGEHNEQHNNHQLAHARFDAFLLKIASALITIQIFVAGVSELDFKSWIGPFYLIHKIPVVASVWLQYLALAKAMTYHKDHWRVAGRRCAMALALAALCSNFLEWLAQFVKRGLPTTYMTMMGTSSQNKKPSRGRRSQI